jgi:hypothetical protein
MGSNERDRSDSGRLSPAPGELNADLLVGARVHDASGHFVGRIEEIVAEPHGRGMVVREFVVAELGVLERFGGSKIIHALVSWIGGERVVRRQRIPWDRLDLSDPAHPRRR